MSAELAEAEEFRAYVRYGALASRAESKAALRSLSTRAPGAALVLPALLLAPVRHALLYHHYVLALLHAAPHADDREALKQVECTLQPVTAALRRQFGDAVRGEAAGCRDLRRRAAERCADLARAVDNWDGSDLPQTCTQLHRGRSRSSQH